MEKELIGKSRKLTRQDFLDIRQLIIEGWPMGFIARRYGVTYRKINRHYKKFDDEMSRVRVFHHRVSLGHKDCSYYTEEEMIEGMPHYSYNELSNSEKAFYEIRTGIRKFNTVKR
jgi:hypothetical protein